MAELATAGSLVGLISLSIQSCQGLTSYYSAWKSYDEQIGHSHRNLDELRITCENLERELQRITQYQEPAVQQVVRLIASCRDGINSLRDALEHCQSVRIPDSLTAKIKVCRARALFPFRKQTLQRLEDTVRHIQGNLGSALQILQLHISSEQAQTIAILARAISNTETIVHGNQTAIQALSSPIQAINQAFPLIKQQNDATAITLKAVHKEAHDSRQEARQFRDKSLIELTKLADRVDSFPRSLERSIATSLDRHGAEMSQLKHDLQYAHSQDTNEVVTKLEVIDRSIKSLQLGLISKPSLMQLVCKENDRLENLSGRNNERREGGLISRDRRRKKYQRCSCKPKHNSTYTEISSGNSYSATKSTPKWKFIFETESMSHHHRCHLCLRSYTTTVAKFCMKRCGAFLSGAIEASISITRGAGGFSMNPGLQCARVVPVNNPAFELLYRLRNVLGVGLTPKPISEVELSLEAGIQNLARLFRDGKASPYDVDIQGNTLLHVSCRFLFGLVGVGEEVKRHVEMTIWFFERLAEFRVPLNWTDDLNLTFMNTVLCSINPNADLCSFVKPIALLLDAGAEFANLSASRHSEWVYLPLNMTIIANSAESVHFEALEDNELSIAIWHRSEQELDRVLRESPQLIDKTNGLTNTPLHLAVGWPYGVRALLQHGACANATDQSGFIPLYYAINLGIPETVKVLMKADCSLMEWPDDLLGYAIRVFLDIQMPHKWHVSQEARMDVLDTAISSLAERRRNLQSRLTALSAAVPINPRIFQDDRILDEYAQYAERVEEDAMRDNEHMLRHASSLIPECRTVYHVEDLTVEIAEKLWQNGFRDIDVPDAEGMTPLMCCRNYGVDDTIEVCSWFIQKGAKLHRLQHKPLDYDADLTISAMELPPVTRALHYVAYNIGVSANYSGNYEQSGGEKQRLQIRLPRLSVEAGLFAATVVLDVSYDGCVCACSSQGCLAFRMMLKSFTDSSYLASDRRIRFISATKYIIHLVGPNGPCPDWLAKEIIRFVTFTELELRHTCCERDYMTQRDPEEQAEIRDEDHEKIELLETLLPEFEEHRGTQDVISFLRGYWTMRMDRVHQEQGRVDREALREIGVVLHEEDGKGSDGEGSDEDRSDEEVSDRQLGDDDHE